MKTFQKSTPEQVKEMRKLYQEGWRLMDIARKFKKDHSTIFYWIKKFKDKKPLMARIMKRYAKEAKSKKEGRKRHTEKWEWKPKENFYQELLQREKQKNCLHRAIVNGRCWLCKKKVANKNEIKL